MKRTFALVAVAAVTASAMAIDRSDYEIVTATATEIGEVNPFRVHPIYSNLGSGQGYVAKPAMTGILGVDDYVGDFSGTPGGVNNGLMTHYQFIGGAATMGTAGAGLIWFEFFDTLGNYFDGFGALLPQTGNYLWTVTLSTPMAVPTAGYHQVSAEDGTYYAQYITTGTWFMSDATPTFGSSDPNFPGDTFDYGAGAVPIQHMFGINSPAPGALALLGLAGLIGRRRR